ncbi:M61 family metallopeptidase [Pseudoduganella sp. RAF19]|uniref:M61 family metallopeptidase n=2 Tax=unclassified Pseudoduganella TaxID=2637179 RepID=UPI003F968CA7
MKLALLSMLMGAAFSAHAGSPLPAPVDQNYPGTLVLKVDASDTVQNIFRVKESIPAKPGKMTLLYPQWVPANHGPSSPINQFAGLKISANGKPVTWHRDNVNVFAFHVEVPAGTRTLDLEYQFLSPTEANQGRTTMTPEILGIQWHAVTMYPAGYYTRRIPIQATVTVPQGWQYGSALELDERKGDDLVFKTTDLETFVDSPLFAGHYFKRYDLDPGAKIPVHMNVVADTAEAVEAKPEQLELHRNLIKQAYKLFQSQHYKHYDFLFALSDEFGGVGREHHQSSENGVKLDYFTDWNKAESMRGLLPHEFTHSWDGKFRRPAGQDVPDFNTPLQNDLLWVYEGQTQFWGQVLSARSGLQKSASVRDQIAVNAARYSSIAGREWRTVQDTTYDPIINSRRPLGWSSYQRSEDYYNEGALIWLDVDTKLREMSGDKLSLDDFARKFYGVKDGMNTALHYTFDDVVKTLNSIQPYDWASFLHTRVEELGPAPLDGLARAGWKLVFTDKQTEYLKSVEDRSKSADFIYSLGFNVGSEGKIESIQWDGAGFKAGLSGNTTLLAVNGRAYKPELLRAAVTAAKDSKKPIDLLVKHGQQYRTVSLAYYGGLRYPRLERIEGTKDRLEILLSPLK